MFIRDGSGNFNTFFFFFQTVACYISKDHKPDVIIMRISVFGRKKLVWSDESVIIGLVVVDLFIER